MSSNKEMSNFFKGEAYLVGNHVTSSAEQLGMMPIEALGHLFIPNGIYT